MIRFVRWCISPFTGHDGRPSWSKLITLYVVTLSAVSPHLNEWVAIVTIAAAHGTKYLLAALPHKSTDDAA